MMQVENILAKVKNIKKEFKKREIPFVDRHTHTITKYTKSFDLPKKIVFGEIPIEKPSLQIIQFASNVPFDEIAITDHSYEIILSKNTKETTQIQKNYGEKSLDKYIEYTEKVKRKYSKTKVLSGIELKVTSLKDFDFLM